MPMGREIFFILWDELPEGGRRRGVPAARLRHEPCSSSPLVLLARWWSPDGCEETVYGTESGSTTVERASAQGVGARRYLLRLPTEGRRSIDDRRGSGGGMGGGAASLH